MFLRTSTGTISRFVVIPTIIVAATIVIAVLGTGVPSPVAAAEPFVAFSSQAGFIAPPIVVHYDAEAGTGFDWSLAAARPANERSDLAKVRDAARYLQEGIENLTGTRLEIHNDQRIDRGLVLVLADAAPELARDAAVAAALRNDGRDSYNDREAFYVRSERERLTIVSPTADGLLAGVVELLESVDYEVLGMGPNWVYIPDRHRQRLSFEIDRGGRPSYYIRGLSPTSGQFYGVGTIMPDPKAPLSPPDEPVSVSYTRWAVGARIAGQSMAGFPGHAMQGYHRRLVDRMKQTGQTDGFLVPATKIGLDAERPPAAESNAGWLWINSDEAPSPVANQVFRSDGKTWSQRNLADLGANLDFSVPAVRQMILEEMQTRAEAHFTQHPDKLFVFGTDPEDGGGYAALGQLIRDKNWYPEYLTASGGEFGRPYVLHGYNGLDQPREIWDPAAPSDTVFGFNNWLLREFDRWIDSRPAEERVTASGQSKKQAVRCSLYSYNYHDVPPNFNLDPRIRVMIAGYPKHRGLGKWKQFASQQDMARAYQVLLPREPSGDYRIISLSYFHDLSAEGIPPRWSNAAASILRDLQSTRDAGIRAMSYEVDFNYGKYGLGYCWLRRCGTRI